MTGLAGARIEASLTLALAIVYGGQQPARQHFVALGAKADRYHQAADNCRCRGWHIRNKNLYAVNTRGLPLRASSTSPYCPEIYLN